MEGLTVFCFEKLPTSHIFLTRLSIRLYCNEGLYLDSTCKSLCPFRPDHSPHIAAATLLPHHNLCALWVFSSMRGSLTGAPEAFGANFATIFVFSSAKSPHGYPRVTWFHWVKPHRLLAAIHVYVQMCEIHGISWNKKTATTNCTLHSGHHRILSHVLLQCLVNPSTAPR